MMATMIAFLVIGSYAVVITDDLVTDALVDRLSKGEEA